jgi:bifunctional DNA-binding transcriptional regulator/antitoxin component of YhaV-PrlF toxin-antitoxin module
MREDFGVPDLPSVTEQLRQYMRGEPCEPHGWVLELDRRLKTIAAAELTHEFQSYLVTRTELVNEFWLRTLEARGRILENRSPSGSAMLTAEISNWAAPMTVIVKDKAGLIVPSSVRRQAGIKSGDRLEFKVSAGAITITPLGPASYKPTRSEIAAIRKGEAAIARGESVSLSDFLHGLDRNRRKAGTKASRKISC